MDEPELVFETTTFDISGWFAADEPIMNVYVDDKLVAASKATIEIGSGQPVEIDKMYGPLIFANLRITADADSGDWIIERMCGDEWNEYARIPGQLEEDFESAD
jgi:hypothetical protein